MSTDPPQPKTVPVCVCVHCLRRRERELYKTYICLCLLNSVRSYSAGTNRPVFPMLAPAIPISHRGCDGSLVYLCSLRLQNEPDMSLWCFHSHQGRENWNLACTDILCSSREVGSDISLARICYLPGQKQGDQLAEWLLSVCHRAGEALNIRNHDYSHSSQIVIAPGTAVVFYLACHSEGTIPL